LRRWKKWSTAFENRRAYFRAESEPDGCRNFNLTVSASMPRKPFFFFGGAATAIGSHLWLQITQRNSGCPPLMRMMWTQLPHITSRQYVQR
jgi:hypothetical protein